MASLSHAEVGEDVVKGFLACYCASCDFAKGGEDEA